MNEDKGHSHEAEKSVSDARLVIAIALNLLLSVVEVVAGLISGSLALMADALHNFNDCMSLVVTLVARIISRKQPDNRRTFGYRRAEDIGALINLTFLIFVGLYLLYEAIFRYFNPQTIEGWPMVIAAGVALVVDVATVWFLYGMAKGSLNLRAGFLHKLSDALASVGVIVAGVAILVWQLSFVDLLVSAGISGYILWQGFSLMGKTVAILMESVPDDIDLDELRADMKAVSGVRDVHHLHVWRLDDEHTALEAHVLIVRDDAEKMERIKSSIKDRLREKFNIAHSMLEFEFSDGECETKTHESSERSG